MLNLKGVVREMDDEELGLTALVLRDHVKMLEVANKATDSTVDLLIAVEIERSQRRIEAYRESEARLPSDERAETRGRRMDEEDRLDGLRQGEVALAKVVA